LISRSIFRDGPLLGEGKNHKLRLNGTMMMIVANQNLSLSPSAFIRPVRVGAGLKRAASQNNQNESKPQMNRLFSAGYGTGLHKVTIKDGDRHENETLNRLARRLVSFGWRICRQSIAGPGTGFKPVKYYDYLQKCSLATQRPIFSGCLQGFPLR
jgi:hypothetical protein